MHAFSRGTEPPCPPPSPFSFPRCPLGVVSVPQNAVHSSSVFRHRRFASYMEPLRPLLGPMVEQYEHSLAAAISAPWRQTGEEDLCTEGTWDEDGDEAHPDEL